MVQNIAILGCRTQVRVWAGGALLGELVVVAHEPDVADERVELLEAEGGGVGRDGVEEEDVGVDERGVLAHALRGAVCELGLAERGAGELAGLARLGVEDFLLLRRRLPSTR